MNESILKLGPEECQKVVSEEDLSIGSNDDPNHGGHDSL